jgi:DMSO/TMAO reductase YedYZ molybdopterin-dependent catalytic subunit
MTERSGGLTRRDLLKLGAAAGPVGLVAACGWDGGSALAPKLRLFSRVNDWVGEKILLGRDRLAPQYPVSARTDPRNFPAYSITYNKTGRFPNDTRPEPWTLNVGGLVRTPMRLTRQMISSLPSITYTVKHHCVEGWTAIGTWTGVPSVRQLRLGVLHWLGYPERDASADHPGLRLERSAPDDEPRCTAPTLFAEQARI